MEPPAIQLNTENRKPETENQEWAFTVQGRGPDLLLLHGFGASSFSWRDNVGPLSRHYRVWTLDLPAHGASPAPLEADYSLEALARGVLDFMDRRGIRKAAVVGNSLGGSLALLLARDHPERVTALVLIAPGVAVRRIPWIFYPLRLPGLGLIAAALLGPWLMPLALRVAYHRRDLITPEVVAAYAAPFRDLRRRLAIRRLCRQLRLQPLEEIAAWLGQLRQPAVIIWGREDLILPVTQAYWLKDQMPRADFHLLPEVGHAPQEEVPEVVNKIIIDFLGASLKN